MSTAQLVRDAVGGLPVRAFIAASDVPGSRRAVECEFSRLAGMGEVVRARKGLYWKGPKTRVGMPLPRPADIALAVAGAGAGPAEISAAHMLGLTTQVPAVEAFAVPGRTPTPVSGTRFVSRDVDRRTRELTTTEVAFIEVLRGGPPLVEVAWEQVAELGRRLAGSGELRVDVVDAQIQDEHHVAMRERWAECGLADRL